MVISMAAREVKWQHFLSNFLVVQITYVATEIAGKLFGIWNRLRGPAKTTNLYHRATKI